MAGVVLAAVALSALPTLALRWLPPPATSFMVQRALERREPVLYAWRDWPAIAPPLGLAVVAAEDQRFPEHRGFDLVSISDALAEREAGGHVRGASTITQQVAKNLYLWPGRSWVRKGLEAWLTLWIELLWPKRRILEVYLNVAEFGDGVFGAEAAAHTFFGKRAAELGPDEAALLAAVLPNPHRLHADRPSDYVRGRAAEIRGAMERLGGLAWLRNL